MARRRKKSSKVLCQNKRLKKLKTSKAEPNLDLKRQRSSHQRCSVQKGVLRNSTKFTGKQLYQNLFFHKVTGLRPATLLKKRPRLATLLKKRLWHRCFLVNFVKFVITLFLQNTPGRFIFTSCNRKHETNKQSLRYVLLKRWPCLLADVSTILNTRAVIFVMGL